MIPRAITGTLPTYPRASVRFRQLSTFIVADATYLSGEYAATTDQAGDFSIALPVPDTGTVGYLIELPDGSAVGVNIGAGAATTLEALLAAAFVAGTAPDLLSLLTGPPGPAGPAGATGADSTVPGPAGATGATGAAGPAGTTSYGGLTGVPSTFAPSAHASSHASAGGDPVTLEQSQITGLAAALATYAVLTAANVFTLAQRIAVADAATNTATVIATLGHNSSGTPAANFGARLLFNLDSATVDDRNAAAMDAIWTTATDASRASSLVLSTVSAGGALATRATLSSTGLLLATPLLATTGNLQFDGTSALISTPFGTPLSLSTVTGAPVTISSTHNTNNTVVTFVEALRMLCVATPAAGFGVGLKFQMQSSTTTHQDAGSIAALWTDATHATRTAAVAVQTVSGAGALTERARIDAGAGANTTGFLLYDVNSGTVKRVNVGAADSGGVGQRMLTIVN